MILYRERIAVAESPEEKRRIEKEYISQASADRAEKSTQPFGPQGEEVNRGSQADHHKPARANQQSSQRNEVEQKAYDDCQKYRGEIIPEARAKGGEKAPAAHALSVHRARLSFCHQGGFLQHQHRRGNVNAPVEHTSPVCKLLPPSLVNEHKGTRALMHVKNSW
jgi:hypothetical protein